jgi:hypothetical protein
MANEVYGSVTATTKSTTTITAISTANPSLELG